MSTGLESMYQDIIIDAAKARHGFAPGIATAEPTERAAISTHASTDHCAVSHQLNPTCGDEITLQVALDPTGARVADVAWEGQGCSISMASASLFTDLAVGKTVAELHSMIDQFREVMRSRGQLELDIEVFDDATALSGTAKFIARVKCAMLAWVAAEDALLKIAAG